MSTAPAKAAKAPPKVHILKKNEKLRDIAKKHGFRDEKELFNHKDNAKLKKLRKEPGCVVPGDKIVIPLSPAKLKELNALITKSMELITKSAEIEKEIARTQRIIVLLRKSHKQIDGWFDDSEKRAKKLYGEVMGTMNTVDTVKELTDVAKKVKKEVGKLAVKNVSTVTDVLAKEAVGKIKGKTTDGMVDGLKEFTKNVDSNWVQATRATHDSWGKIQKPSFWAAAVGMLASGESWSDAVTFDIKEHHEGMLNKLALLRQERHSMYYKVERNNVAYLKKLDQWRAETKKEMDAVNKAMASFGD